MIEGRQARLGLALTTAPSTDRDFARQRHSHARSAGCDRRGNKFIKNLKIGTHQSIHSGGSRGGAWNQTWQKGLDANKTLKGPELKNAMFEQATKMAIQFGIFF
jgi:hypothetical protein